MQTTKKQIGAIVAALIGGGAVALQYLDSGPNVIAKYGKMLPALMQEPKFIGIAVTVIVTGLVIALILAPWGRKQQTASTDDPRTIEHWLIRILESCTDVIKKMVKTGDIDQVNTAIVNAVDHEIPTFLQSAISKSARVNYEAAITSARSGGVREPIDVFLVATKHIFGLLAKRDINRDQGPKGRSV